jgi:hypothetical protein
MIAQLITIGGGEAIGVVIRRKSRRQIQLYPVQSKKEKRVI